MGEKFYLLLGSAGSVIALFDNLPMLFHLAKEKCSDGQSITAWVIWELSSLMLFVYALHIKDIVFSILQFAWIVFGGIIITLVVKYRFGVKNEITN